MDHKQQSGQKINKSIKYEFFYLTKFFRPSPHTLSILSRGAVQNLNIKYLNVFFCYISCLCKGAHIKLSLHLKLQVHCFKQTSLHSSLTSELFNSSRMWTDKKKCQLHLNNHTNLLKLLCICPTCTVSIHSNPIIVINRNTWSYQPHRWEHCPRRTLPFPYDPSSCCPFSFFSSCHPKNTKQKVIKIKCIKKLSIKE